MGGKVGVGDQHIRFTMQVTILQLTYKDCHRIKSCLINLNAELVDNIENIQIDLSSA